LHFKPGRTEQAVERTGETFIVVHDCDTSFGFVHPGEPLRKFDDENSAGREKLPIVLWCNTGIEQGRVARVGWAKAGGSLDIAGQQNHEKAEAQQAVDICTMARFPIAIY
jgi:hypothetical protein